MICFRILYLTSLLLFGINISLWGYEKRELLQKEVTLDELKSILVTEQKWVIYPPYSDRKQWNALLGDYKDHLIRQGEQFLKYNWQVIKASDFLAYERIGSRNRMQGPHNKNNMALSALILAELAEGKGRFLEQIVDGIFFNCEKTTWAVSAHLTAMQKSGRALPELDDPIIDLSSGEIAALMSWAHYFFQKEFDAISPQINVRLEREIHRQIFKPYMNVSRFRWQAINYKPGLLVNNWTPWCNFNVLQCYLLWENDRNKLAEAIYRTICSVDQFINYAHSDGACEEGPGYWGHAAGKLYDYLELLSIGTSKKVDIFHHPIIRNMGEYIVRSYAGKGWVVNFADASARGEAKPSLLYAYGKGVDSKLMKEFSSYLLLQMKEEQRRIALTQIGTDIYRGLRAFSCLPEILKISPKFEIPSYSFYPETQFCYMYHKNSFFVACKGGYNNESHNHNDVGSFILYSDSIPVFIDVGVGTYTRQTFSKERYKIWTMQSDYHNLPQINGFSQQYGNTYKADNFEFDIRRMSLSMNIAPAYSREAQIQKWIRTYQLKKSELIIKEKFQLNAAHLPNRIHFLTWNDVDDSTPGKLTVQVKQNEKVCLSYNPRLFCCEVEKITLQDPRLSNIWGERLYRISLKAINKELNGHYVYKIFKIK